MKLSSALKWVGLVVIVVLAYAAYRLGWSVIEPKIEQRVSRIGLTSNEVAANGPLPGDVSLYAKELACQQKVAAPGYYPSLNAGEVGDGQRSGLYPCATFTGSFDGPNQVFAWRAADDFAQTQYIVNRRPGEIFVAGGANPPLTGLVPPGPYVARVDAATGKEHWRTYFENANASGRWLNAVNLNIMANGKIVFAWQNNIALIDPDTGLILKHNILPTGNVPASGYKNLTIAPDGTVFVKSQTRPTGSQDQGTMAIISGVQAGLKQPNSYMVAVNPDTLEVLDQIQLPEPSTTPHIVAMFEGRIAIYIGVDSGAMRYFWDPAAKKLSRDETWTVSPMEKGQTTSDAPSLLGDWIILQTNGLGSKTAASSIVAVHQKDAKRFKVLFPFGPLKKDGWSFAPPKPQTDPENNMIWSADMGMRKVAGIKLDPATGEMKVAYTLDYTTTGFQPLYGPKDKRVVVLTNMKLNVEAEPLDVAMFTANYTEQVTWNDAATGKQLAASDFFDPMTFNGLVVPGYGGRFYYTSSKGFIVFQVMPKRTPPAAK